MRTLTPGEWYLLFKCIHCSKRQVLFPDLSQGKSEVRATYTVECPECGGRGSYDSESLERYQHPKNGGPMLVDQH
jgi:DNA-directed RNA polymerase subunit RPC12/RpoP